MALRIVTYNIHKAVGLDRQHRPDRILTVLDEVAADVAVLQEADRRFGDRASALPPLLIAQRGWRIVPVARHPIGIGWHGNAILVRESVEILRHASLALPTLEPRGAIMADLRHDGSPFRVVGMHLDLSGLARRRQARTVLATIAGQPEVLPTVIVGDLNEWRRRMGVISDFGRDHEAAPLGPSFPSWRPVGALDRIFLCRQAKLVDCGVHHGPLARMASDHLPAWADIALPA